MKIAIFKYNKPYYLSEHDTPMYKTPVFMNYIARHIKEDKLIEDPKTFKIMIMDKNEKVVSYLHTQMLEEAVLAFIMYTIKEG